MYLPGPVLLRPARNALVEATPVIASPTINLKFKILNSKY